MVISRTKIDWCDYVWNCVWGCLNNCEYCYAKKLARRFWKKMYEKEWEYLDKQDLLENNTQLLILEEHLKNFKPIFLESSFNKPFPKRPARIFSNSMSECAFWKEEWWKKILKKIYKNSQHTFIFLTKFPIKIPLNEIPRNIWVGVSIDNTTKWKMWQDLVKTIPYGKGKLFISFEPLLNFDESDLSNLFNPKPDWIIIGSQTNPLRLPSKKWVEDIIKEARRNKIPVFIKENLWKCFPEFKIQEFPDRTNGV